MGAGPEKDAWEYETGRVAVEQGKVVLPDGAMVGFQEFMSGGIRELVEPARRQSDPAHGRVPRKSRFDVPLLGDLEGGGDRTGRINPEDEFEALPTDEMTSREGHVVSDV